MSLRLEDYALIGDTHTAALVGVDGAIDWLCLPRFDSPACFAALLGRSDHGHWTLAPTPGSRLVHRAYVPGTLVLHTDLATDTGVIRLVDCMPIRDGRADLVRRVVGLAGQVRMVCDFRPRFGYGSSEPHWSVESGRLRAAGDHDAVYLDSDLPFDEHAHGNPARLEFTVSEGQTVDLRMCWTAPGAAPPPRVDVGSAIHATTSWWHEWSARCHYAGPAREAVQRSLVTLKALTYAPSGGIVAAPTTSLPERLGGEHNWDYRYCWIRDATFTLLALVGAGYDEEASAWREWLLRTVSGHPEQLQVVYGVDGERRLAERTLDWLPGYADSSPVRVGNAARPQFQLDIYGEVMDMLHHARAHGLQPEPEAWDLQRSLMDFLEGHWRDPDSGIWELREQSRHFTHSKVMAWAGVDRAIRAVETIGLHGPLGRWRRLRAEIFEEVCEKGFDPDRCTFTQAFGSSTLDAAVLQIAKVGFLPATDERVRGTTEAVERELCEGGFVQRYSTDRRGGPEGFPHDEGAFLPCTFWLADIYVLQGRTKDAGALFARLLDVRNDVGLLSEEYDVANTRLLGNYPQALSHISLVNTALDLARVRKEHR